MCKFNQQFSCCYPSYICAEIIDIFPCGKLKPDPLSLITGPAGALGSTRKDKLIFFCLQKTNCKTSKLQERNEGKNLSEAKNSRDMIQKNVTTFSHVKFHG